MKVAAIIPALNEEKTIRNVIRAFCDADIDEVIVIDDGSSDRTALIAREAGARVLSQVNQGKGAAMRNGAASTDAEIIFFADADLLHFSSEHVHSLLAPVLNGTASMTIGLRDKSILTHLAPYVAPVLGGERVLSRHIFEEVVMDGSNAVRDFGIETIMNAYCKKKRLPVLFIPMRGVSHVIKENKYGFMRGFIARIRMIIQIIHAELHTIKK